eukprot:6303401-Amphidinium_carterae.1
MENTVRQLLNEVQRLVGEQQTQAATVAALQRELQQAGGGNTRMDPLKLGRPPVFTGDKAAYEDWAFKFKTFMGQESTTVAQWMREMENAPNALDFDLYVEEKKKEAVALYFCLVVLIDKTVLGVVIVNLSSK